MDILKSSLYSLVGQTIEDNPMATSLKFETLRSLESSAHGAISRVIGREPADEGKGAMFRLYHLESQHAGMRGLSELWAGWIGGNVNRYKHQLYSLFATEKALRTAVNYQRYGHVTSFESRMPDFHQYQGASVVRGMVPDLNANSESILIVTVSGLAAINDQRTGLLTVDMMGWKAGESIAQVVEVTQDSSFVDLRRC